MSVGTLTPAICRAVVMARLAPNSAAPISTQTGLPGEHRQHDADDAGAAGHEGHEKARAHVRHVGAADTSQASRGQYR